MIDNSLRYNNLKLFKMLINHKVRINEQNGYIIKRALNSGNEDSFYYLLNHNFYKRHLLKTKRKNFNYNLLIKELMNK